MSAVTSSPQVNPWPVLRTSYGIVPRGASILNRMSRFHRQELAFTSNFLISENTAINTWL